MKWLIYGSKGWIGQQVFGHLTKLYPEDTLVLSDTRVDDEPAIEKELTSLRPDRVLCLIGRTHGPGYSTIDYLEQKERLVENVRDNLYGPLILAILSSRLGFHLTYMGTGCIFQYSDSHPNGFTEEDCPNFFGSSYSVVKGYTDRLLRQFDQHVLNCRIRMPITSVDHPRNFISKIIRYKKICSIQNSMTVLDELLPIMLDMARNKRTGTINLTNPGCISHNEILDMYIDKVDPNFRYQNFTIDEQRVVLKSDRSNNLLDTSKLQEWYPRVRSIHDAVNHTLENWKTTS